MKKITLILLLMISFLPSSVKGQIDSIINNDFFLGRALFLDGKEVGHSTGYLKGQKKIRDSYYTNQNTVLVIERDSVTKSIIRIDICNVNNGKLLTRAIGWEFQQDTLIHSYTYELPKWETYDSTISYFYYPNGLLRSKSSLLKKNNNYATHIFFYPTQYVEAIHVSTDSTVTETYFAKNGKTKAFRAYHLNKQFYDLWVEKGGIQNAPLIPLNLDKHGEWLYYDENGRLIKKEIYEYNELKETIEYVFPEKRKSRRR
jgi:antitoxin component YwqK of YwqJK toxin-antitoxin module